jgi:hypothetical protein
VIVCNLYWLLSFLSLCISYIGTWNLSKWAMSETMFVAFCVVDLSYYVCYISTLCFKLLLFVMFTCN